MSGITTRRQLTALEAGALRAALMELTDETGRFNICLFEQMTKVYGAIPDRRDYEALRLLHCIKWRSMDASTRKEALSAIMRTFAPDQQTAEVFAEAFREPTPEKVSLLRRLTGGVS